MSSTYEPGLLHTAQRRFVTKGFMESLTVITLFVRTKVQSTTDRKTIKLCFQQSENAKYKQEHHVIYQLKKKKQNQEQAQVRSLDSLCFFQFCSCFLDFKHHTFFKKLNPHHCLLTLCIQFECWELSSCKGGDSEIPIRLFNTNIMSSIM